MATKRRHAALVARLQAQLHAQPRRYRARLAALARKRLDLAEEPAHFMVQLEWRGSVASEAAALARHGAALPLPGSHPLFTGSDRRQLATQVRAACGAPVYVRARR